MARKVCIIDVPGLSRDLLSHIPASSALGRWVSSQKVLDLTSCWPAVTCPVQATLTTGVAPAQHGIVANGMATFRSAEDQALVDASNFASYRREISFWEQSNQFVQAPRFWQDSSGKSHFKTAMLFFQHCMPGFSGTPKPAADIVLTPKPDHGPDGKQVSLCWSDPPDLVPKLFAELGPFPLMNYWGPMAGIASSQWIARAAARVWMNHRPKLQLVYVPHLDYDLQRFGPRSPQADKAVEDVSAALAPLVEAVSSDGGAIILLSEYAMRPVDTAVAPNRLLAAAGLLVTRQTPDGPLVDYARSDAFALVDHQIAHVYVRDAKHRALVKDVLAKDAGLRVLSDDERHMQGVDHRRAGDLLLEAADSAWFDYHWWATPDAAPAFAKLVDIHRKPGYDPMELFWDRATNGISQQTALIRDSHGLAAAGQSLIAGDIEATTPLHASQFAAQIVKML